MALGILIILIFAFLVLAGIAVLMAAAAVMNHMHSA